jgi:hypothetical protein
VAQQHDTRQLNDVCLAIALLMHLSSAWGPVCCMEMPMAAVILVLLAGTCFAPIRYLHCLEIHSMWVLLACAFVGFDSTPSALL